MKFTNIFAYNKHGKQQPLLRITLLQIFTFNIYNSSFLLPSYTPHIPIMCCKIKLREYIQLVFF